MADTTSTVSGSTSPTPRRKRSPLKWVLLGGGVLFVGGGLLVLLAPTLLSTGAGKDLILGQVNNSLAGRVEAESWSLGWFSGIKLENVKVYDDQKRLAVSIGRVSTGLTLLNAVSGNYNLGDTVIDSPNLVLVEVNKDGSTNLQRIARSDTSRAETPDRKPAEAPKGGGGSGGGGGGVPNVTGSVTIKNLTGTIQGEAVGVPVRIGPSDLIAKIPSLASQPVSNDVRLMVGRDGQPMGTLTAVGTVQAIYGGKVDVSKLNADEKLTLAGVDLGALAPVLAASGLELKGIASGDLAIKAAGLEAAAVSGSVDVSDLVASGRALKGDTFRSARVSLPLDVSTSQGSDGSMLLTIRRAGIESAELTASVQGEATQAALQNLAKLAAPGAQGKISVRLGVPNVGAVAQQLRSTMSLGPDVSLTSGSIDGRVDILMEPSAANLVGSMAVSGVKGTKAGAPVVLSPINANYDVSTSYDGRGLSQLNIKTAALDSGFAKLRATGTLQDLAYTADVNLDRAHDELAQVADLGGTDFAGFVRSAGTLKGDLRDGGDVAIASTTNLTGVRLLLPAKAGENPTTLNVDRLATDVGVVLQGKPEARVTQVQKLLVQAGPPEAPVLNVDAVATVDVARSEAPMFEVRRLDVPNLAEIQNRFSALIPALAAQGIDLRGGAIRGSLAGSYAAGKLTLSKPLSLQASNLTIARAGRPVLQNETITAGTQGLTYTAGPAGGKQLVVNGLDVSSSSNLIELRQTGDTLTLTTNADGTMGGSGGATFAGDLARLAQLAAAWSGGKPSDLRAGRAGGQITFAQDGPKVTAKGNLDLTGLTVGQVLSNESVSTAFDAASPDSFKTVSASAELRSAFANLVVKDARLDHGGGMWDLVQQASVSVRSDDLAKVDALLKALSPTPPSPTPAAAASARPANPDAAAPVVVRSGSFAAEMSVARQGSVTSLNVSSLKVDNFQFSKGSLAYRLPQAVDVTTAVDIDTQPGNTTTEQIRQVAVSKLDGSLGVANIRLVEPLVLTNLSAPVPTGKGAVELAGRLQTVTALLEVLQGAQPGSVYPYVGDFAVNQKVRSEGSTTWLAGGATVSNLKVLDTAGKVLVAEDRLEVANNVGVDPKAFDVTLQRLGVNTASSGAINLEASGLIRDALVSRRFEQPLKMKLGYDLARLMPLVVPVIDPKGETFGGGTFTGKFDKEFVVSGAYPANLPKEQGIKQLKVQGGLAVAQAVLPRVGIELANFDQAIALDNGLLILPAASPAQLNGGTLDVSGAQVDLTQATPRLSTPANKPLIRNVELNKLLGDRLGKFGSFLLANNDETSGRLNVDIVQCQAFPLGDLAKKPVAENDGVLQVNMTIPNLRLAGGPLGDILAQLDAESLATGELSKGLVTIQRGAVEQEMLFRLSVGQIRTDGGINLSDQTFRPLTLYIAPAFLQKKLAGLGGGLGAMGQNIGSLTDLPITITGTTSNPKYNVGASFKTYAGNALKNIGNLGKNLLHQAFNGNKNPPSSPPSPSPANPSSPSAPPPPGTGSAAPAEQPPANPLGGLLQRFIEPKDPQAPVAQPKSEPKSDPQTRPTQPPPQKKKKK